MASIGPAGAMDTHRYDHMRYAQDPQFQVAHPTASTSQRAPPLGLPDLGPPPSALAPSLPDEVLADLANPHKRKKFRLSILQAAEEPGHMEEIERLSATIHSCENSFTKQHR
jgi:hypothetical protein